MAKVLCILWSSLILITLYHHVTAQPPGGEPNQRPPFAGFGFHPPASSASQIRLKGLCQDGWMEGSSQDIYGNEIQICIRINGKSKSWEDAKATCRQDFGFLLKLDSPVKVDENDLISVLLSKGITSFWTGAHTEDSHLIWDDLVPNLLRPNNDNQSTSRPWMWSKRNPSKLSQYCGKLKLHEEDDDDRKKRKKRQIFETSESDSSDSLLSNTDSLFGLNPSFDSSQSGSDGYPQTSAFQEMLARTQFNDQLAALPTAVGVQSPQQLAGSGLTGANLQKGGLATVSPLYSQSTEHSNTDSSDKDVLPSDTHSFLTNGANLGFQLKNERHNINTKTSDNFNTGVSNHGQLFNHQPNPTETSSLIDSVREQAAKLGLSDHLPSPNPTEMLETIKDHMSEHGVLQNTDNSDTKQHDIMGLLNSQLSDIIQAKGQDHSDSKSHDILNIDNPSLLNVSPTEQSRENLGFGPQDILSAFNNKKPDFIQNGFAPTTVSPLLDALIDQNVQNTDDSSMLSETVKDLLQGVTNSDRNQKDLSDSAKDMLQTLQPEIPSHSETIESLADKLISANDASITTPATNIFDGNHQKSDSFDRGGSNNFPDTGHDSELHKSDDQSHDFKTTILSSDDIFKDHELSSAFTDKLNPILSGESSKVEPPTLSETDNKISDTLRNYDPKNEETNVNSENIGIPDKESILADTVESLSEIANEKIFETPSINANSGVEDSSKLFGKPDETNDNPVTPGLLNERTMLTKLDTDDDDKDKTKNTHLQSTFHDENEEMVEPFLISGLNQNYTDLLDANINNEKTSKIIDTLKDDENTLNDFVEIVKEDISKVPSELDGQTGELSVSSDESESQKTITDNLNNYLSVTKPDDDDNIEIADKLKETIAKINDKKDLIQNDGGIISDTGEIETPNDIQIEHDTQPDLNKEKESLTDDILQESNNDDDPKANKMDITDGNAERNNDTSKINDLVNSLMVDENEVQDEVVPEETYSKSSDSNPKETTELENDLDDSKTHIADRLDNTDDTEKKLSDNIEDREDPIDALLKEFKRNTTQDENDDDRSFLVGTDVDETDVENMEGDNLNLNMSLSDNIGENSDDIFDTNFNGANVGKVSEVDDKDDAISDDTSPDNSDVIDTVEEILESTISDTNNGIAYDDENDKADSLESKNKLLGTKRRDSDLTHIKEVDDLEDNDNADKFGDTDNTEMIKESVDNQQTEDDEIDDKIEITKELHNRDSRPTIDDIPTLAETIVPENEKKAILPAVEKQELELSTCSQKLPSVCFTYQIEVMSKVSTCEKGWYGHILHNKCYRILNVKQNYREAEKQCSTMGADIIEGGSEFERTFSLLSVSMDGTLFRGTKFWKQSPIAGTCQYYDETGIRNESNCNRALNAICEKPAQKLDVITSADPDYSEEKLFMMKANNVALTCDLTSNTHELPVLWFKDGLLVSTITSDDGTDSSLRFDRNLIDSVRTRTNRFIPMAGLQGKYWCEVWDKVSTNGPGVRPVKRRSSAYDVRFSDVMSFHGSMKLQQFTYQDELLFNLIDKTFPSLSATETDLKKVFRDVLPVLKRALDYVTGISTHVDRVRSSPRVLEYHTYITLTRNYSVVDEIEVYNKLKGLLRVALGNAEYMARLPGKTPVNTFRTMALQSTISCPAASLRTNKDHVLKTVAPRIFKFRHSLLGERADSNETCSDVDLRPAGSAKCLGDFYTGAYWGDVRANDCTPLPVPIDEEPIDMFNEDIWGKTVQTDTLTEMAKTDIDETNVENITGEVAKITADAVAFTPTDINKIADVLEHTTKVDKVPEEVGRNVIKTVDKLMTLSEKEVEVANVETGAANRIIKSLEKCAENVDMTKKNNFRLVTDNIAVEVWMLKEDSRPVIGLAAHSDEKKLKKVFKAEDIATVFNKTQLFDANVDAAIELPKEAFAPRIKGQPARNKLTMMVFRKSKLFEMAAKSADGKALNMDQNEISKLNSYVISASIAGKKLTDLKEKVRTIFKPLKESRDNHNCVFWDFNLNERKGGWSNKGCIYDGRINGREVCLCDHLTNFAVLLDFYGQENPIHQDHELSLSIITIIGLSFSILGLALTIVSFVFFKKLRQGRAQQTLFNLAVALLCAMLVFLVGIKQTHHYWWCLISAALLHYFVLASFMWMLMEAILQYLTFVKILGTYITRFTLKTVIPAWGLPLVPVITIFAKDYTLYKGGSEYCWMSLPAFYYGFAIPISCIIVTNIVIFIITIISIFRRGKGLRSNQKKKKVAMTNLQAAITSFILLGLSWLFGYLAISDARLPFQYIFTILNSLQGFFIFILFVVRKKKVREQWYIMCCKGMDREKVSRSLSASNSIPSSYSNGSNRSNSKNKGQDRDRSDSTKTVTSTFSNGSLSNGFTNYGYDKSFDVPYNRRTYRNF